MADGRNGYEDGKPTRPQPGLDNMEYGSGGRKIAIVPADPGVVEGISWDVRDGKFDELTGDGDRTISI